MFFLEVIVTAQSVILGFACARILHSTPYLFSKLCDIKIYLVWYILILHIFTSFWTSISISRLTEYDFLDFILLMIYQGLAFIMSDTIFPTNSDKIINWDEHYFKRNKTFWFCLFVSAIVAIIQIEKAYHNILGDNYFVIYFVLFIPWILGSLLGYSRQKAKMQWIALILITINVTVHSLSTLLGQYIEIKF